MQIKGGSDQHMTMQDWFKETKEKCQTHLSILCGRNFENSMDGMTAGMHYALEHGNTLEVAKAMGIFATWVHCDCEEKTYANGKSESSSVSMK